MSAFIRIYTQLGKENICAVEAFALATDDYSKEGKDPVYTLKLYDTNEENINCIKEIIKEGQPCNIHIRHEEKATEEGPSIEVECKLEGCCILNKLNQVQYLTYREIKL